MLLSFCFSHSLSFIIYQFLLLFLPFPLSSVSFSALPVLLRHFSSCPSLPQFSTKRIHRPLNFSFTEVSLFSSSSSLRFFLCPLVHIIMFLDPLARQVVIYHGVALDYNIYLCLFIFSIYYQLYWFLFICSLF